MKKVWGFLFSLAIIVLLIVILKDIDFYEVYLLIAEANLFWFILAVLASGLTFVVWNFRWIYILKSFMRTDFWYYLKVLFAGAFFNTVTPGAGIGGEPFRAYYLAKKYNKPKTKVLGYVIGDTFFRMFALFVFVIFSVLFVLVFVNISNSLTYVLEGILIFIILSSILSAFFILKKSNFKMGVIFAFLHKFSFIRNRFSTSEEFVHYVNSKIKSFMKVFRKVVKKKTNIFVGTTLSFAFWIFNFLTAYFLFLAFGQPVNFLSVIIVFTLGSIIGSLSPIPGGIGVVEGSMTLLYSAMGIPPSMALLVSFLQRIIYYFFSLLVGGWCLVHLRKENNNGKFGFF